MKFVVSLHICYLRSSICWQFSLDFSHFHFFLFLFYILFRVYQCFSKRIFWSISIFNLILCVFLNFLDHIISCLDGHQNRQEISDIKGHNCRYKSYHFKRWYIKHNEKNIEGNPNTREHYCCLEPYFWNFIPFLFGNELKSLVFTDKGEDRRNHEQIAEIEKTNNWSLKLPWKVVNDVVRLFFHGWYSSIDSQSSQNSHNNVQEKGDYIAKVDSLVILFLFGMLLDHRRHTRMGDKSKSIDRSHCQ